MADIKITDLAAYSDPVSTDVLPIVDVGSDLTKKVSIADLLENAGTGTVSAPSFSFDGDNNTGIYRPAADQVAVSAGGTQALLIESSGVTVPGNLTVQGTTTTIDTTTLVVEDKNVELGSVATPTDTTANGGGITLKGASDKTINWVQSTGCWTFNQPTNFNDNVRITSAGNVGIGTSNPQKQLHLVSSTAVGAITGEIAFGSVSNQPQALIEGRRKDGSYKGELLFSTSGQTSGSMAERMRIDSSGNVGIGTTSPSALGHLYKDNNEAKLLVEGNGNGASAKIAIDGHNTAQLDLTYRSNTLNKTASLIHRHSGDLSFETLSAERLRIDSSGNVGIGTTTPSELLSLSKSVTTSANLLSLTGTSFGDGETIYQTFKRGSVHLAKIGVEAAGAGQAGELVFETASSGTASERLRIDSSGNVGIGTTSPQRRLHVDGTEGAARFTSTASGNNGFEVGIGTASQAFLWQSENSYIHFATNNTERMRIDSSGNVGIGTSSIGYKLHLQGTNNSDAGDVTLRIEAGSVSSNSAVNNAVLDLTARGKTSGGTALYQNCEIRSVGRTNPGGELSFHTDDTSNALQERLRIDSSGNVGIGTTSPQGELHLHARDSNGFLRITNTTTGSTSSDGALFQMNGNDLNINNLESGNFIFHNVDTERMRIDSSGRFLVGTSSSTNGMKLQVEGLTSADGISARRNQSGSAAATILLAKSRGTSTGSSTAVQNNDTLGTLQFSGADGTNDIAAAFIRTEVDGTPGTNDMPGRLVLATTADGASSPTERMRIDSNGVLISSHATINGGVIGTNGNELRLQSDINANGTPFTSFYTGSSERMRIDSSGRLLVGTSSSIDVASTAPAIMQVTQGATGLSGAFYSTANALGPGGVIALGHGRNSTTGLLSDDDVMGQIRFAGADGTDMETVGAQISAEVDGTPGSNDMPGRLVFSTTADGASSTTERMRIDSSGRLLVGTTSGAGKFIVQDSSLPKVQANFNGTKHIELGVGGSGCGFAMTTGHFMSFNHQPYADRGTDNNLTERMRILSSGGITFNGDTAQANALDDYEEGTFNPFENVAGTFTGETTRTARYTKIGNMVHCDLRVEWTGTTGSTGMQLDLPFAEAGTTGNSSAHTGAVFYQGTSVDSSAICSHIGKGNSKVQFYRTDGGSFSIVDLSSVNGSYDWIASFTYFVA